MLRVLLFLAIVAALAFGFAWLADRPGTVAIDWMGYQIELSAMTAMVAILTLVVLVMAIWWVLKLLVRSPQIMGGYFSSRRRDKAYEAHSSGLVAAGSGDARAALRYAGKAAKLAPDDPLTHVLAASSADLNGDGEAKRRAYRRMLDDPKTQLLGLRGLYLDAVSKDDDEAARHYAGQASALAPALGWAGEAQFEDQVQRGDWPAARAALERNVQAKILSKVDRNRVRAVLLAAEAIDREAGEPDAARALALEAHKLAPDLVPAAAVAGRLLIRASKMTQASKVIETTWKKSPHPELTEVYLYVRPGDAVADRVKRARKLSQLCSHQLEGELALTRALMEAGDLDGARTTLMPLAGVQASQRVCLLMAEIEEKAGGDTAAVRGWMARALRAKRDPAWVADGYVSSTWEPVSPLSGRVDAFEWRVPMERFAGHEPLSIPADAMDEDGHVMLPARLPTLVAAGSGSAVALDRVSDARMDDQAGEAEMQEGALIEGESVIEAEPAPAAKQTDAAREASAAPASVVPERKEAERPKAEGRAPGSSMPDDPGTAGDEPTDEAPKRRFRLF